MERMKRLFAVAWLLSTAGGMVSSRALAITTHGVHDGYGKRPFSFTNGLYGGAGFGAYGSCDLPNGAYGNNAYGFPGYGAGAYGGYPGSYGVDPYASYGAYGTGVPVNPNRVVTPEQAITGSGAPVVPGAKTDGQSKATGDGSPSSSTTGKSTIAKADDQSGGDVTALTSLMNKCVGCHTSGRGKGKATSLVGMKDVETFKTTIKSFGSATVTRMLGASYANASEAEKKAVEAIFAAPKDDTRTVRNETPAGRHGPYGPAFPIEREEEYAIRRYLGTLVASR